MLPPARSARRSIIRTPISSTSTQTGQTFLYVKGRRGVKDAHRVGRTLSGRFPYTQAGSYGDQAGRWSAGVDAARVLMTPPVPYTAERRAELSTRRARNATRVSMHACFGMAAGAFDWS